MASEETSFKDKDHAADTVLEVGQRLFHVNRRLLASTSEYFRALFGGGTRESSQNHIVLWGLDPEVFQLLLGFAARGRVSVDRRNVEALLEAADFLLFDRVKLLCAAFLQRELRVGNCAGALTLAQRLACPGLAAAARGVALTHLVAFMTEEEEFLQLPKEVLAELLASDHLYVAKEDQVFEAVMKWVCHHNSREGHFLELLALVRAPFLTLSFLDLVVKRSKCGLQADPHSRLLRILNHSLPQNWTMGQSQTSRTYETMYVLGGKHEQEQQELFQFHPQTSTWQACSPLRRRNLTQYAVATGISSL